MPVLHKLVKSNKKTAENPSKPVSNNTRRLLATIDVQLLQALKGPLIALLAILRAQLIVYTNKKLKNFLAQQQFITGLDDLTVITNTMESSSNFIDRLPIEAVKGIPPLYNSLEWVKDQANKRSYQARSLNYTINQLNSKQTYYDFIIQQIDGLIREIKGLLEYIEAEAERGTA